MSGIASPKYRRQKKESGDLAFVELNGARHYLGCYDTPESKQKYHRLLAEWSAAGQQLPVATDVITILELAARFLVHAKSYYVKPDGTQSHEYANFKPVLKLLNEMYGDKRVNEFGPLALKAVRERMIRDGRARTYINKQCIRTRLIFRWGVAEEIIEAATYQALLAVPGLKRGRTLAKESDPVRPAPAAHIEAVEPFVSRQLWAMIQLQILTGARPGELVIMRPVDIDTSGKTWFYRPITHKTAYRDRPRTVYMGPKAQGIVRPFLVDRALVDFLFSPQDAEAERRAKMHVARKTPMSCGNVPGSNRTEEPELKPGARYTVNSYRRAIERACISAGVPVWSPGQLRHNAATNVRKEFGLEAAQLLLGHAKADVTQLYAEVNELKAIEVAAKIG